MRCVCMWRHVKTIRLAQTDYDCVFDSSMCSRAHNPLSLAADLVTAMQPAVLRAANLSAVGNGTYNPFKCVGCIVAGTFGATSLPDNDWLSPTLECSDARRGGCRRAHRRQLWCRRRSMQSLQLQEHDTARMRANTPRFAVRCYRWHASTGLQCVQGVQVPLR